VTTEDKVIQQSHDDVLDPPTEEAITGEREHVRRLAPFLDARPRSIVRPGAFVLLDGEWRFERDPENCGLAERWYVEHDFAATANWPGSVALDIESTRTPATVTGRATWRRSPGTSATSRSLASGATARIPSS
jgi:hypothetical protein